MLTSRHILSSIIKPNMGRFRCLHKIGKQIWHKPVADGQISPILPLTMNSQDEDLMKALQQVADDEYLDTTVRVTGPWLRDKLGGRNSSSSDLIIVIDKDLKPYEFVTVLNQWLRFRGKPVVKFGVALPRHRETTTIKGNINGFSLDFVHVDSMTSKEPQDASNSRGKLGFIEDLTISSLLYNLRTGDIEDYTGHGIEDVKKRIIRTSLPAEVALKRDPTTLLRGIRIGTRYQFGIDPDIFRQALAPNILMLLRTQVPRERIGFELFKMVESQQWLRCLLLLHSLRLIKQILPHNSTRIIAPVTPVEIPLTRRFFKLDEQHAVLASFSLDDVSTSSLGYLMIWDALVEPFLSGRDGLLLTKAQSRSLQPLLEGLVSINKDASSWYSIKIAMLNFRMRDLYYLNTGRNCGPMNWPLADYLMTESLRVSKKDFTPIRGIVKGAIRYQSLLRSLLRAEESPDAAAEELQRSMEYMKSQLLIPFDTEPPETILRIGPVTRLELGQLISVLKENSQPALLLGTMDLIFEEINNQIGMRLRASSPTSSQSRPFEQNFTVGALLNMLGGGDEVRELMSQIDNADVQPVLAAMVAGFDVSAADLNLKPVHDILQAANKLVSAETTFKLDANAKHILGGTEIMELFGIPETSNIECKSILEAQANWRLAYPNGTAKELMEYLLHRFRHLNRLL